MSLHEDASSHQPDQTSPDRRTESRSRAGRRPELDLEVPPPDIEQAAERNHILRAVPRDEYAWLLPHLEAIRLDAGETLAERNAPARDVFFPETAIVAALCRLADGADVQVGTVGREGMVGLTAFLGVDSLPVRMLVQVPGGARRMPADVFADGAQSRPVLRQWLRRYTHAYLAQVSQTAACNRRHDDDQRCARWLLMTHDRAGSDSFLLPHESLASLLGASRDEAAAAIERLRQTGAVRYHRDELTVLDRAELERAACECYEVVREHYMQVLGAPMVGVG
jgi:CRP-like cAMP-binding protein